MFIRFVHVKMIVFVYQTVKYGFHNKNDVFTEYFWQRWQEFPPATFASHRQEETPDGTAMRHKIYKNLTWTGFFLALFEVQPRTNA